MKLLRIAAIAALTAFCGIFASAGNAAPVAGLLTGAPTVRTLATPAPKASVEKAYGHLEKYPFRAACKSDSKNLFEFDHRERVRWGNWVSLI